jgi:hypothetical protein
MIIGAGTVSRKMNLRKPILVKNVPNPHRKENVARGRAKRAQFTRYLPETIGAFSDDLR